MDHKRALLVEDNPADVRLLREALADVSSAHLIKLTAAGTLAAALRLLQSEQFDVAILDLSLPDTDGLDGLSKIQDAAPDLPVLVLTGRNDSDLAVQAVREGAQDYLVKGQVNGELLVRAMRYAEERKRATQQLKRSEERFRSLLENGLDIIAVLDESYRITYASPSMGRILGFTAEDLQSSNAIERLHPDDVSRVREALETLSPGAAATIEVRVRERGGQWRVLEAIARRVENHPVLSGVIINARDITERHESEKRLKDLNHRLRTLIETSPLGIVAIDTDGCVVTWNRAAEEIFGWTQAEVLYANLPVLDLQSQPALRNHIEQARCRALPQAELRLVRRDKVPIDVSVWTSPLPLEGDPNGGLVAIVADITERHRLEEQFRQSQKMEAIGRLAGGVAHDFNNLLTVISGYSQSAQNRIPQTLQAHSDLQEVLKAADRAASLTKQLLTLSRRQDFQPALVNLNALVVDMERMLLRLVGEDIVLTTSLAPNLRPVVADRGQLELVLLNLVINARDAMPAGGRLVIETANSDLVPLPDSAAGSRRVSGARVVLSVSDTGIGMDASVLAQLFEPFFTTKQAGKGTGLGLSTSYSIVRQHRGDIWVDSEKGSGSTFRVSLPAAGEDVEDSLESWAVAQPSSTSTILVLEHDEKVANIIRQTLEMSGHCVLLTGSAQQALEVARTYPHEIHLLLTESVLQSDHGVDLWRQIRTLRPCIATLLLSMYDIQDRGLEDFATAGHAYLRKPFAPEVLAAKVRDVLAQARGGERMGEWIESDPA